jgi:hypothetical protein
VDRSDDWLSNTRGLFVRLISTLGKLKTKIKKQYVNGIVT